MSKNGAEQALIFKALSHSLRVRILHRADGEKVSPVIIATEFEEPLANISYHVRFLAEHGLLRLASTAQRRGAIEHYYVTNALGKKAIKASKQVELALK